MSILNPLSWFKKSDPKTPEVSEAALNSALYNAISNNGITVNEVEKILGYGNQSSAPIVNTYWDGGKYPGGYGLTEVSSIDYYTLRQRSAHLFKTNLYAYGIINRLITNEINTGLTFESIPEPSIVGISEDDLETWSENLENKFSLWAKDKHSCDAEGQLTFGQLQAQAKKEALIEGDVLVVTGTSQRYGTTTVRLVSGSRVNGMLDKSKIPQGHKVTQGVETDATGKHVAYYVINDDGKTVKIPAVGPRSGKRIAWMVYGSNKRYNEVRGMPLISIILQSLREIDRYRDSAQRKAVLTSMLAIFIKKEENNVSSLPISQGAAVRNDQINVSDNDPDIKQPRKFNASSLLPGLIMEELNQGETPQAFGNDGTDVNFPVFETAMLRGISWSLEMPPEILELSFQSNYSASQAAINEFKMYLNRSRTDYGDDFCHPVFIEWIINATQRGVVSFPLGVDFLVIARDPSQRELFNAWTNGSWAGQIKPSTDPVKTAKAYEIMVNRGWITNDRAAKEITGTKFSKNVRKQVKENQQLMEAKRPMMEAEQQFGVSREDGITAEQIETILAELQELKEDG